MKDLIEDNYKSIVSRGLITPSTNAYDFLDKLKEEIQELKESLDNLKNSLVPKDEHFNNINEELSDVVLVCLNFAKHYDIDIESELENKIKKNFARSKINK